MEYLPGNGKRQNVHTKKWVQETPDEVLEKRKTIGLEDVGVSGKIKTRKEVGLKSLPEELQEHPKRFASYTPKTLKKALEEEGHEVKPLGRGAFKNITFEDGGGWRVGFGGDGVILYHPEEKSHHGGAYYKISTGKNGVHRYELNGEEKKD